MNIDFGSDLITEFINLKIGDVFLLAQGHKICMKVRKKKYQYSDGVDVEINAVCLLSGALHLFDDSDMIISKPLATLVLDGKIQE